MGRCVDTVYLLPGRHQPPHDDHFAIFRAALARVPGDLFVALIVAPPVGGEPKDDFERSARAMNQPSRCPYSYDERRRMIEAGAAEVLLPEETARLRVVPLIRPEAAWSLVEITWPERRVWIVPDVGEAFDDDKARFFSARGDEVLRLRVPVRTSGHVVRQLIASKDAALVEHVPSSVAAIIRRKMESEHEAGSHDRRRPWGDREHLDRNGIVTPTG